MTIAGICRSLRSPMDQPMDRCLRFFPCLVDPSRRSTLFFKLALVTIHLVYAGVLFLFDRDLIENIKKEPWYTTSYLLLFVVTLIQYFVTSISSPGYVIDAWMTFNERNVMYRKTPETTKTWTCTFCNVEQPPRSKHCHDCDKCVLQFDHHCVWLGNCVGLGNHCLFWWYLCEEAALCLWTGILYVSYLKDHISSVWWQDAIMVILLITLSISLIFLLLLLIFHSYILLTNQTTYELIRRRRIPYLRGIPEEVHPFSKGICRNIYNFCCARFSRYNMERIPTSQELEDKSRPYTCRDVVTCRCC